MTWTPNVTYVVPCGAGKLTRSAAARELYTSPHFAYVLAAAEQLAHWDRQHDRSARVLILSDRHGLITPATILAPYDTTITDPDAIAAGAVTRQARAHGIDWPHEVYALLPRRYFTLLHAELTPLDVWPQDVYEGTSGIGDQRRVCRHATRAE